MKLTKEFVREEMKRAKTEPKRFKEGDEMQGYVSMGVFYHPDTKRPVRVKYGIPLDRVLELSRMGIDWEEYCKLWIEIDIAENKDRFYERPVKTGKNAIYKEGRGFFAMIIDPPRNHGK